MSRRSLEAPVFFTSASRVKIPFVGDDTRKIKHVKPSFYPISNPLERHHNDIADFFVKSVSTDIRFEKDVVRERCSHKLPFREHTFKNLYDSSGFTSLLPKGVSDYAGRFDSRGYIRKMPSHLKKIHYPDSRKKKVKEDLALCDLTEKASAKALPRVESIFLTEIVGKPGSGASKRRSAKKESSKSASLHPPSESSIGDGAGWDEYLLDLMSKDTAHWIVYESLSSGIQKEKLNCFLRKKYGVNVSNTNIVRADVEETDLNAIRKIKDEEKKRDMEMKRLREKGLRKQAIINDSQLQQTMAEYYKLPRFLRQQRSRVITASKEVNATAQNIFVKHLTQSPPPKMEDFLNPAAGKYINTTENAFEQQLYTRKAKLVHQKFGDRSHIIMDDLSEYLVATQPKYPPDPDRWLLRETAMAGQKVAAAKGMQRWLELPKPADFMSERGLNPPKSEEAKIDEVEYNKRDSMIEDMAMITVVEEWRTKWKLAGRWQEMAFADIILEMDSLHDRIRLGAVAACAMAALHKKPINDLTGLAVLPRGRNSDIAVDTKKQGHLPDKLISKVEEKLKDFHKSVRLAAAICLYSLDSRNEDVLEILKNSIDHGHSVDRLAAAQCLSLNGDTSSKVIRMLIQLLLESDNSTPSPTMLSQKEQATTLLVYVSSNTRLVHSLLAEQLNSGSWKERVIACQVLAKLVGNINKDLVHKLTHLMWHDWSSEVRKAAAETLGHTGHGRDVHFELRDKLADGNERVRVNVLKKIAHLGIMTAALMPSYMSCFCDDYVSVRLHACHAAGKLQLGDDSIIAELVRLTQFDPAWKIKAHAIKALGEIGKSSLKIQDVMVWALRFEDEPGVRMEACKALRILHKGEVTDEEVLRVLQDRVLVEPHPKVKNEVRMTLEAFGMSGPEDNMDMIRQIKTEVKRLCSKAVIAAKITMYENELEKYQNKAQYVGTGYEESTDSELISTARSSKMSELKHPSTAEDTLHSRSEAPDVIITPSIDNICSRNSLSDGSGTISELMVPDQGDKSPI